MTTTDTSKLGKSSKPCPDALVAHVQLSRLLSDFGAAGRAG